MSALVICTTKGTCLPVMAASVSFYLPEFYTVYLCGSDMVFPRHRTINLQNNSKNFRGCLQLRRRRSLQGSP
jgi:hypothetical protein